MKKKISVDKQHINELLYRMNYKVNESPRYRPIMEKDEQFDKLPEMYNEADGLPAPEIGNKKPLDTDPSTEAPILNDPNAGAPAPPQPDATGGTPPPATPPIDMNAPPTDQPMAQSPEMPLGGDAMGMQPPTPKVDDIQNDIIKSNLAAMEAIHNQLLGLNSTVDELNQKMVLLSSDVEEVREPTNTEKLMNKGQVSYPYYFNLNDMWSGNWFNEKRQEEGEKGMKKLEDGTYVADFDDLPQHSKIDIEKSFNNMV